MPWPNVTERRHAQLEAPRGFAICRIVVSTGEPSSHRISKVLKNFHSNNAGAKLFVCKDGNAEETSVILCVYTRLVQHYPVCTIQVDILTEACNRCLKLCASGLGIFQPVLPHAHPSCLRCPEMRRARIVLLFDCRFILCLTRKSAFLYGYDLHAILYKISDGHRLCVPEPIQSEKSVLEAAQLQALKCRKQIK